MTKKEYNAWLDELATDFPNDPDTMDIVATARQASKQLKAILNNNPSGRAALMDWIGLTTAEEFDRYVKDGRITIHGRLMAVWCDGF